MFGATRSSRRHRDSTPCPCNNVCRCHRPSGSNVQAIAVLVATFVFLILISLLAYPKLQPDTKRYIHVGNQICEIKFKTIGCTSTGGCWGYEEAICPQK